MFKIIKKHTIFVVFGIAGFFLSGIAISNDHHVIKQVHYNLIEKK